MIIYYLKVKEDVFSSLRYESQSISTMIQHTYKHKHLTDLNRKMYSRQGHTLVSLQMDACLYDEQIICPKGNAPDYLQITNERNLRLILFG